MKLPNSQLSSHLERGLASIYLVAADEPLIVAEATDAIRRAAMQDGYTERSLHFVERGFKWDSLRADADSLSLFSSKRIVELRMARPKPGDAGAKAIRALAEDKDPDRVVIISIQSRLDRSSARSVWVSTVEKHGVLVESRPVSRNDMPRFIGGRARLHGLSVTPEAAKLLADRVEGNLLAADQELAKLALILDDGRVDEEAVLESVATSARFDVFRLSEAVIDGDLKRAFKILDGLRTEGVQPPLVLWALAREVSLLSQLKRGVTRGRGISELMNGLGVWQSRRRVLERALARYSNADLARLLRRAASVDRAIKGGDRAPVWESISSLVLQLLAPKRSLPTA
ncbi:MAG: DNA polymerase III subunit delta [Gammaproteobacteria bacterium]